MIAFQPAAGGVRTPPASVDGSLSASSRDVFPALARFAAGEPSQPGQAEGVWPLSRLPRLWNFSHAPRRHHAEAPCRSLGCRDLALCLRCGTQLSAAIGLALIENGYRVLFARTTDLAQRLQAARRELAFEAAIRKLDKFHVLVLDYFSDVTKDQAETSVLFELISARYEQRSC